MFILFCQEVALLFVERREVLSVCGAPSPGPVPLPFAPFPLRLSPPPPAHSLPAVNHFWEDCAF